MPLPLLPNFICATATAEAQHDMGIFCPWEPSYDQGHRRKVNKQNVFQCHPMICQKIPCSKRWIKIPITFERNVHNQLAPSNTNGGEPRFV